MLLFIIALAIQTATERNISASVFVQGGISGLLSGKVKMKGSIPRARRRDLSAAANPAFDTVFEPAAPGGRTRIEQVTEDTAGIGIDSGYNVSAPATLPPGPGLFAPDAGPAPAYTLDVAAVNENGDILPNNDVSGLTYLNQNLADAQEYVNVNMPAPGLPFPYDTAIPSPAGTIINPGTGNGSVNYFEAVEGVAAAGGYNRAAVGPLTPQVGAVGGGPTPALGIDLSTQTSGPAAIAHWNTTFGTAVVDGFDAVNVRKAWAASVLRYNYEAAFANPAIITPAQYHAELSQFQNLYFATQLEQNFLLIKNALEAAFPGFGTRAFSVTELGENAFDQDCDVEMTDALRMIDGSFGFVVTWKINNILSLGIFGQVGLTANELKFKDTDADQYKLADSFYSTAGLVVGFFEFFQARFGVNVTRRTLSYDPSQEILNRKAQYTALRNSAAATVGWGGAQNVPNADSVAKGLKDIVSPESKTTDIFVARLVAEAVFLIPVGTGMNLTFSLGLRGDAATLNDFSGMGATKNDTVSIGQVLHGTAAVGFMYTF